MNITKIKHWIGGIMIALPIIGCIVNFTWQIATDPINFLSLIGFMVVIVALFTGWIWIAVKLIDAE